MQSNAVREFWSCQSKHGDVRNTIYGFSGSFKQVYKEENDPDYCILSVADDDQETSYLFNNGDGMQSWERMASYIGGCHRMHIIYPNQHFAAKSMILSLYGGELMGSKHGRTKMIIGEPLYTTEDGVDVYDFTRRNLFPAGRCIPLYGNGYLAREGDDIRAQFGGHDFYTEYDLRLYSGLYRSVCRWKTNLGKRPKEIERNNPMLIGMVSDFVEKECAVSFAELVYQYHHCVNGLSLIEPLQDDYQFCRRIRYNHKQISDDKLVCDHLTENRSNNYSWALALIPSELNKRITGRAAIAKPYFFYTVWDEKSGLYKLKLGYDDGTKYWERRYSFTGLDEMVGSGKYLYKEILEIFKKRIGPKYEYTDGDTWLRQWSNPQEAYNPQNPMRIMLKEPATYPDALTQFLEDAKNGVAWPDMPMV